MALHQETIEPMASQSLQHHIINTISEYYRFLTRLPHVDPNSLVFPPEPHGWQSIKENELKARGRSDEAIDLLRRLPYLRNSGLPNRIKNNITNDTLSIAYCDGELEPAFVHQQRPTPGNIIWLTCQDTKEGSYLLLDISIGTITSFNPLQPGSPLRNTYEHGTLDPADEWMNYATLPIADFFNRCRRMYEKLVWIHVPGLRMNNSKGTAHHYERIMQRDWQDYYLYTDDEYDDAEGDSDSGEESEDESDIPEEEVDQLMKDAAPDRQTSVEIDRLSKPITRQRQTEPIVEDDYQTDVMYEDAEEIMKQTWQDAKKTYYIYKNNGWPATNYDRAHCTQQLREWLEAKKPRI